MLFNLYEIFIDRYISIKYNDDDFINIESNHIKNRIYSQQDNIPDYLLFAIKSVILLFLAYNLHYQSLRLLILLAHNFL